MGAGRHHLISPTCARLTGFGGGFPRMIWRSCLCWVCMCGVFACLTTAFEVFQSGSRFLVLCVPCLYSHFMTSGKLDCNARRSENITQVACMFFDNGLRTSSLTNCFFLFTKLDVAKTACIPRSLACSVELMLKVY